MMRIHMERLAAAAAFTILLLTPAAPVPAVVVDWDDLTDAQQKQAYEQLESENQKLREMVEALQGGAPAAPGADAAENGGASSGTALSQGSEDAGTGNAGSDGLSQSEGTKSTETFLADIKGAFNARQEIARTYTNEQLSAMDVADMWSFRFQCAEAERGFYDAYHAAQLDDLNVCYLCSEYCLGLEKQFQAEEIWNAQGDADEANRLYTAGYYNRAYALVELSEYYGLDLADEYQNLKNAVARMDELGGEETRNISVDPAKVMQVQELLNSLGFLCGTPDGIAGRQTGSCIERFQKMYGYEPADGIIDDELVGQLTDQLSLRKY